MKIIYYGLFLILISSCYTEMKVKVDVMDLRSIKCSEEYRNKILTAFNEKVYFQDVQDLLSSRMEILLMEIANESGWIINPETLKGMMKNEIKNTVEPVIDTLYTRFKKETDSVKCNLDLVIESFQTRAPQFALNQVTAQMLKEFGTTEMADLISAVTAVLPQATKLKLKELIAKLMKPDELRKVLQPGIVSGIQNINTQTQFGEAITEDPLASMIVEAPEKYWTRYNKNVDISDLTNSEKRTHPPIRSRINKTTVRTFMGNADIAIKMDAPGFFIVKGVRLDADQAFKISAKVLNQGIKYLAYASGIPVSSPSGTTAEANKFVKIPEINIHDSLQLKIQNVAASNKLATETLIQILFIEAQNIDRSKTHDDLKASVNAIQQAFTNYKTQVNQEP